MGTKLDDAQAAATLGLALDLAAGNAEATVPCPACGAGTKGKNLASHVDKVHPDSAIAPDGTALRTEWKGRRRIGLPARLRIEDAGIEVRRTFTRRSLSLPVALVAGGVERKVSKQVTNTGLAEGPRYNEIEKAGTYLQFGDRREGITVACRRGPSIRKHWDGTESGKRRRSFHIRLDPQSFVSLQYALASRGHLAPRGS